MSPAFRRLPLLTATVVMVATGCDHNGSPVSPTSGDRPGGDTTTVFRPRPGEERIAFSTWKAGRSMIHTMDPDGSRLVEVVEGYDPSFSPDGTKLAFWRYTNVRGNVFVANVDGSNPIELAEGEQPTWSPDGQRLAYGCGGICLINVDGSGLTHVTLPAPTSVDGEACVRDSDPTWSPDGSTIAFTRWTDTRIPTAMCLSLDLSIDFPFDFWTEVWLIDADGSNPRPVRDSTGNVATYAGWPSWSPDGKRLAFYGSNATEERIDVASANGSWLLSVVARPPLWDRPFGSPAWSPDGSRILFGTANGWGFADASGSGSTEMVRSPISILPNSLSWSWSRP
jgi:TolB protein